MGPVTLSLNGPTTEGKVNLTTIKNNSRDGRLFSVIGISQNNRHNLRRLTRRPPLRHRKNRLRKQSPRVPTYLEKLFCRHLVRFFHRIHRRFYLDDRSINNINRNIICLKIGILPRLERRHRPRSVTNMNRILINNVLPIKRTRTVTGLNNIKTNRSRRKTRSLRVKQV